MTAGGRDDDDDEHDEGARRCHRAHRRRQRRQRASCWTPLVSSARRVFDSLRSRALTCPSICRLRICNLRRVAPARFVLELAARRTSATSIDERRARARARKSESLLLPADRLFFACQRVIWAKLIARDETPA